MSASAHALIISSAVELVSYENAFIKQLVGNKLVINYISSQNAFVDYLVKF